VKKILMTSAALTALLIAVPLARAQTAPGAGAGERKEAPAAAQNREPAGQAGEMKSGAPRAAQGEKMREERGGAQRSAEEPKAASPGMKEGSGAAREKSATGTETGKPEMNKSATGKTESGKNDHEHAQGPTGPATPKAAENPGASHDRSAETKSGATKPETGRAERNETPGERSNTTRQQTGESQTGRPAAGATASGAAKAGAGGQASLDDSQQSKLRDVIGREKGARVDHVDFSLNVGTRVPEHVHFRPLPSEIVSIVPQYRGYDYFVANDEIVIIEPRTREIVTILPAGGEGRGRVPAHHARLDRIQERVVYKDVIQGARPIPRTMHVTVGERIPTDVELMPLPQMVVSNMPDIRDYRYFVVNRDVVLVDPETREIIEIIRE
jgi:hypothetical protein